MDLTPSAIRRKTFQLVRRGFDPQEVGGFLERLAEIALANEKLIEEQTTELESLRRQLEEARSAEEAVRLTMVAATQAKEEIIGTANHDSEEIRRSAYHEADQVRNTAKEEADGTLNVARREALELLEESRREAQDMVNGARQENSALVGETEHLRGVVARTQALLRSMASGALEDLDTATRQLTTSTTTAPESEAALEPIAHVLEAPLELAEVGVGSGGGPTLGLVAEMVDDGISDGEDDAVGSVVQLPDAVDRLLNQLRDING